MTERPFIFVTLDSLTYTNYLIANTPFFDSISHPVCGRSHGCETLSGHRALLSGHLPECSEIKDRMIHFDTLVAQSFSRAGYSTLAAVSMVLLAPRYGFGKGFAEYKWTQDVVAECPYVVTLRENLGWILDQMKAYPSPWFIFLNVGETHYPYWNEDDGDLPYWAAWDKWTPDKMVPDEEWYRAMRSMCLEQIRQTEWVDGELGKWMEHVREFFPDFNPRWFITADHGEMWGEDGLFNHGHGCYAPEIYVPVVCNDWEFVKASVLKGARSDA